MSSALGTAGASGGRGVRPGFSFCVLRGDRAQPHREPSLGVSCQEEPPHPEPPDDPPKPGPASSHWSPPSLGSAPQVPRGLGRPPHGTGRGQEQPSISQASRGRGQRWGVWTPAEGAPGGGLFLAPSSRPACPAPGPASSALSLFSLCPVTGTCHWPARPWDSLGGRGLCSLFLWTELRWEAGGSGGCRKVSSHLPLNKGRGARTGQRGLRLRR